MFVSNFCTLFYEGRSIDSIYYIHYSKAWYHTCLFLIFVLFFMKGGQSIQFTTFVTPKLDIIPGSTTVNFTAVVTRISGNTPQTGTMIVTNLYSQASSKITTLYNNLIARGTSSYVPFCFYLMRNWLPTLHLFSGGLLFIYKWHMHTHKKKTIHNSMQKNK